MLTVDMMSDYGADVKTALVRCANKEELYLKLVKKVPDTQDFGKLKDLVEAKDYEQAFEVAHGLKGVLLNLSITPLANPVVTMTEMLRAKEDADYSPYLEQMMTKLDELKALIEE